MKRRSTIRTVAVAAGIAVCSMLSLVAASAAPVDPIISANKLLASPTSPDGSKIESFAVVNAHGLRLKVRSAAMNQTFMVDVQRPKDASKPRPTLYLLNGAGGGVDGASWNLRAPDVFGFLANKNVNVVVPIGGKWSYYTDWRSADPELGVQKWKTFLTEELPPLIDGALGTNRVNAIAGLSTSGTSVLQLPIAKPGLYKSVAAYSGCAQISDPAGHEFVRLAVNVWGGGNIDNMYGPQGDPMWAANDPYVNADKLRGLNVFVSTGTGVPGMYDVMDGEYALQGAYGLGNQLVIGGVIEAAVNWCSHNLQTRLASLGIPATFDFQPTGTHSWGYWRDALIKSWPVLAKGLGLPA